MTDNTTLDAAIFAGQKALGFLARSGSLQTAVEAERTYARALIAKLLEGMEEPACPEIVRASPQAYASFHLAYKQTLTEIRRRAGLEYEV
jgi:hypothetical protein